MGIELRRQGQTPQGPPDHADASEGDEAAAKVRKTSRRLGGLRRDRAGVFDETNTDGAARDLDAARRSEAGQRDHRRLAVLSETIRNGERGIAPGVCVLTLGQGLDECLTGLVDGLPVGIVGSMAFSSAASRVSASTVTVLW